MFLCAPTCFPCGGRPSVVVGDSRSRRIEGGLSIHPVYCQVAAPHRAKKIYWPV